MIAVRVVVATLAFGAATASYAQRPTFAPPRLLKAALPTLPPPTVVGGGEVIIETTVDRNGRVSRPIILRGTPPYTQMVLDAIASWRFEPARAVDAGGNEMIVEMPVTIGAIYRPPVLMNTPTIGEAPKDWSKPSGEAAYPESTQMPNYPPHALDGGVVLMEVVVNESGAVTETRAIASTGGFESASRDALARWRFKSGSYRARPVPATAYVLFGFVAPVVSSPQSSPPKR
jgi:outer membrane biosynthesis protein TonB